MTARQRKAFSTFAAALASHYDTLSLPRTASRNQIKSQFYKLSKECHPDLKPGDESAKDRFLAINDAYSILGDEKRRLAYDHEQQSTPSGRTSSNLWESRRRGATYAWQHSRRPTPRPTPHMRPHPKDHSQSPRRSGPSAFEASHSRWNATGQRFEDLHDSPSDRLRRENSIWKVVQVFGMLFLAVAVGNGVSG